MNNIRVVITGVGVISSLGKEKKEFLHNFLENNSKPNSKIIDFDAVSILGPGGIRTLDRCSLLSLCAAKNSIEDANLDLNKLDLSNVAVSLGTMGSIFSGFDFYRTKILENPRYVNPMQFPNTVINAAAGQIAIRFGLNGFNTTVSTGACAGMDAIIYAAQMIKKQKASVVLAGGVEEYCDEVNSAVNLIKNESFSEGAAILVLEDLDFALKRKANILAEIKDFLQSMQPLKTEQTIDQFPIKEKLGNLNSASGAFKALLASQLVKNNSQESISINTFNCVGHQSSLVIAKFNAD